MGSQLVIKLMVKFLFWLGVFTIMVGCSSNSVNKKRIDSFELAKVYYEKALYSESERLLLQLDRDVPNDYDINFRLGNIYVRTGQFPAAELRFRRCIDIDNSEPKAWYNLSLLKIKESLAIADEGYQKSSVKDSEFSRNFVELRDSLIHSITGK